MPPTLVRRLAACAALLPALSAWAQESALCTSDGRPAPRALHERFINADCAPCWREATPTPPPGTGVLDWVIPGHLGDDAPLSAVARREALQRLAALHLPVPERRAERSSTVQGGPHHVRVSRGPVFDGYVGASLTFDSRAPVRQPLIGWLALIELLPAGTEGSPVPRVLMRNLLSDTIPAHNTEAMGQLWRTMNVPAGAEPGRLQLLGWVSDAQGRVLAAAESSCDDAGQR